MNNARDGVEARTARRFRKIPLVIEAMQYNNWHDGSAIVLWTSGTPTAAFFEIPGPLRIRTLESGGGSHVVDIGDWVIRGVNGEHYPCKPDIFAKSYEPVAGTDPLPVGLSGLIDRMLEASRASGNQHGQSPAIECQVTLTAGILTGALAESDTPGIYKMLTKSTIDGRPALVESFFQKKDVVAFSVRRDIEMSPRIVSTRD